MRFVVIGVVGSVMWWGLSMISDTWQPATRTSPERVVYERTIAAAIADVEAASHRLDARIRAASVGEDLSNGWDDLRRDTLSILREMARRPSLDHVDDFVVRVDTFWSTYSPSAGIGPDTAEWKEFEASFYDAVGAGATVMSDSVAVDGS